MNVFVLFYKEQIWSWWFFYNFIYNVGRGVSFNGDDIGFIECFFFYLFSVSDVQEYWRVDFVYINDNIDFYCF